MRRIVPLLLAVAAVPILFAQNNRRVLDGHMRPGVTAANDRGRVAASRLLQDVTLTLQPSAAQQADLAQFVTNLQDPASPDYHHWLTPEQYGARFGLSQAAIDAVTSWLAGQNLTVESVARGRTAIRFSGNVRDVERALQVEIHNYTINGENHFSNASEPSLPAAVGAFVQVVHGLDDFRLKPRSIRAPAPLLKVPEYTSTSTGRHYLAPEDVSTIYDVAPLYNSGITGKGQKIAVVGQTQINLSDIQAFRTFFNLPANDPTLLLVPGSKDPGISNSDLGEADLDVEWAGAVAKDASVIFVYSPDVETSLRYAIDNKIAPVVSMSYGLCEQLSGNAELLSLNALAQEAATLGISWIASSGDNGANDCYGESSRAPSGFSVDSPASVPGVTAIGGTTLTEGSGTYWNALNNANHATALSYIPESVWNDSVQDGVPSSSGGGASIYFTKPAWQTGAGVPADGLRDVPDISLPASADHDAYLVYTGGVLSAFGGTSVGAPVFASVTAMLNQYLQANGFQTTGRSGNLNPRLYALAQAAPNAFHDVTAGDNIVVGCSSSRICTPTQVGFSAAPGYDLATGLGSVDVFNLVTAWPAGSGAAKAVSTVQLTSSLSTLATTDTTTLTATVTGANSTAPTGTVSFYASGNLLGSATLTGSGVTVTATLPASAVKLSAGNPEANPGNPGGDGVPVVTPLVSAIYGGDGVYAGASASTTVNVVSPTALVVSGITSAASFQKAYAPGMIVAMFGQNLAASTPAPPGSPLPTQLAGTSVTVNGIPAPLYYVSPTQVNLQIPYEVNTLTAIVKVTANGQTATSLLPMSAHAPEVFGDTNNLLVPYQTTSRGQTIFLFATGDGVFTTPTVTTGSVPVAGTLASASRTVTVTVGGVAAATTFFGVPSWSIGVSQINFTIPANAPTGLQPVVVSIGSAASAPVYITVTP